MAKTGSKAKIREYFLSNVGKVLSSDEIRQASGGVSEWARRVRELRDEEGYQILSHNDRADLKPGQYVLTSPKPAPAFSRNMSKELRAFVLDRNGFTCQMCGAAAGDIDGPSGRRVRLHIGHIIDKSAGGSDEPSNLRALCSSCNEGLSNISLMRPDLKKLLVEIRRATITDQRAVLQWLQEKFKNS